MRTHLYISELGRGDATLLEDGHSHYWAGLLLSRADLERLPRQSDREVRDWLADLSRSLRPLTSERREDRSDAGIPQALTVTELHFAFVRLDKSEWIATRLFDCLLGLCAEESVLLPEDLTDAAVMRYASLFVHLLTSAEIEYVWRAAQVVNAELLSALMNGLQEKAESAKLHAQERQVMIEFARQAALNPHQVLKALFEDHTAATGGYLALVSTLEPSAPLQVRGIASVSHEGSSVAKVASRGSSLIEEMDPTAVKLLENAVDPLDRIAHLLREHPAGSSLGVQVLDQALKAMQRKFDSTIQNDAFEPLLAFIKRSSTLTHLQLKQPG